MPPRPEYAKRFNKDFPKLKNIHKDERCFILGNGPSLNKIDVSKLRNEITFGCNKIYHKYWDMGGVKYYFIVDETLSKNIYDEINRFLEVSEETDIVFAHNQWADNFRFDDIYAIDWAKVYNQELLKNTGMLMILVALHMGCNPIYLIGMDCDYGNLTDKSVKLRGKGDGGIYKLKDGEIDTSHFTSSYYPPDTEYNWEHNRIEKDILPGFKKVRDYSKRFDSKIYNATVGGKLEYFERVNFNDILDIEHKSSIIAMIPVKLNSNRVKHKNIRYLGDKPLMEYAIDTCKELKRFDKIYLNSSAEIFRDIAKQKDIEFYKRIEELSSSKATSDDLYIDFLRNVPCDIMVSINTTSPFITSNDINNVIDYMIDNDYDMVHSVDKIQIECLYNNEPINFNKASDKIPSENINPIMAHSFGITAMNRKNLLKRAIKSKAITYGNDCKVGYYVLDYPSTIDIDWEEDFQLAEAILESKNNPKNPKYMELE